jgi:hypothetical protein
MKERHAENKTERAENKKKWEVVFMEQNTAKKM